MGALSLLSLLFLIYCFVKWCIRRMKIVNFFKQFPPAQKQSILHKKSNPEVPQDYLNVFKQNTKLYGSNFHFQIDTSRQFLVSSDYNFLSFLLRNNDIISKSEDIKIFQRVLGYGILTSDGNFWKTHRRMLNKVFYFKNLYQYIDIFENHGNTLVKSLHLNSVKKQSFDIIPYLISSSFSIIAESALGLKIDMDDIQIPAYLECAKVLFDIAVIRHKSIFLKHNLIFWFTKYRKVQAELSKHFYGFTFQSIKERRKILQNYKLNGDIKEEKPFIDHLLQSTIEGRLLTDQEICDELNTIIFGGHENPATTVGFALYCLAKHPKIQDKVLEEQTFLFGQTKNPKMTYEHLQSMKYLDCVIKETLRLYPLIPFFGRKVTRDVIWNGITIPEGVQIKVFTLGMHMNPKYYPDPERFNPDRFETMHGTFPYAFIPFSAGPRNCIGQKFAMLEMKSLLSKIIRSFTIIADPTHELDLGIQVILKSLNGIKIGLISK